MWVQAVRKALVRGAVAEVFGKGNSIDIGLAILSSIIGSHD